MYELFGMEGLGQSMTRMKFKHTSVHKTLISVSTN